MLKVKAIALKRTNYMRNYRLIKILILSGILASKINGFAQGVNFSKSLSFNQVQALAKMQHKSIFVDIYATWCGPCIYMADSVFTKKEVGSYINSNFISYQVQTDQTQKDSPEIKAKYAEARDLIFKYKVTGLPTLLFLSPDGVLLDQQVGSLPDAASFIAKAKKAIDLHEQYYKILEQYYGGMNDKPFLLKLLALARTVNDPTMVVELTKKIQQK